MFLKQFCYRTKNVNLFKMNIIHIINPPHFSEAIFFKGTMMSSTLSKSEK